MKDLIKKNMANLTVVLMLLWGIGVAFALPPIAWPVNERGIGFI